MQRRRSLVVLAGVILFGLLFLGPVLSNHYGRWFNGWSGVSGIESHLEDEAREVLSGLDIEGATVQADGRNLTISTADGLSRAAQNNLKAIDGVGSIDFLGGTIDDGDGSSDIADGDADADLADGSADNADSSDGDGDGDGDSGGTAAAPEPTATPEPTGGQVSMFYDGEEAVVSGEVQTAEGRDALLRAARRIAGENGVVDEITLADGGGSTDLEAVTTTAAVIRRVDEWYESASVELSGNELVVSGQAKTEADADRAQQVVEQLAERVGLIATVDSEIVSAEPTPTPVPVEEEDDADSGPSSAAAEVVAALDLSGVTFELGTADLTPEAQGILDDVAGQLRELPGVTVQVQGHTDNQGDPDVNLLLSQERAEAVRDYLIGTGIDAGALTARGFGAALPIADNSTPEGQAANRRVDLTVVEGN